MVRRCGVDASAARTAYATMTRSSARLPYQNRLNSRYISDGWQIARILDASRRSRRRNERVVERPDRRLLLAARFLALMPLAVAAAEFLRRQVVEDFDVSRRKIAIPAGRRRRGKWRSTRSGSIRYRSSNQRRNGIQYRTSKPTSDSHGPAMIGPRPRATAAISRSTCHSSPKAAACSRSRSARRASRTPRFGAAAARRHALAARFRTTASGSPAMAVILRAASTQLPLCRVPVVGRIDRDRLMRGNDQRTAVFAVDAARLAKRASSRRRRPSRRERMRAAHPAAW